MTATITIRGREVIQETNPLKRFWIWFWYNTATRFLVILIPSYFVILIPLLLYLEVPEPYFRHILSGAYAGGFVWAMLDNDYSNLERIGLDVDRRPLRK